MTTATWKSFAASSTGLAHAAAGEGNSDACRIVARPGSVTLIAADGLGSATLGALAAHLAADATARVLREVPAPADLAGHRRGLHAACAAAQGALRTVAAVLGLSSRDLGTTLLACTITDAGAAFGGVGDGFLVIRAGDGFGTSHHHLFTLEPPSTIANATSVLAAAETIIVELVEDALITGVALATDGLEPVAIDRPTAPDRSVREGVIDALLRHADAAPDSESLHRDMQGAAWDTATADDRTIVMAVRA